MSESLVRDLVMTIERLRGGMLTAAVLPVMLGACSTVFEADYGPVPQPVAQNREKAELSAPAPAAEPVAETAAAVTPAAPETSSLVEATEASVPLRPAEPPLATAEAETPAAPKPAPPPVRVVEAGPPRPEVPDTPRLASAPSDSPTPMIAAMTRGRTPPSFRNDDGAAVLRHQLATRRETEAALSATAATTPAAPEDEPDSRQATAVVREGETSTSALAAPPPQPTLSRTYRDQLRAAGIVPSDTPPTTPPEVVEPGRFPSSVPAVIRQNYRESLDAPKTYEQAIGRAPVGSASSVVIGGSGPVVISSEGVYQPVAFVGTPRTGAAATIQFGHNSANLSSSDLDRLSLVATEAKRTGSRVRVVGHASSRTGEMAVESHLLANLRISARRAEAVADALADFGVPYERIVVEAKGDNAPIYNEAMPSGEAGNRRAEIYLEN